MPGRGQPTAAPVPRGQGRAVLTTAAREIFAERGYHGASIREIARRAGLSLSALYYWHDNKAQLLAEVLLDSRRDYLDSCRVTLAAVPGDDPAGRLRAVVAATVEHRVRRRLESVITAREWRNLEPEHLAELEALRRAATGVWSDVIAAGVASGAFACPYPDDARRAIEAACNAVAQWYDPAGAVPLAQLVERYQDIALRIVEYAGAMNRVAANGEDA